MTLKYERSFGAAAVHLRAATVELVISFALLFYGLSVRVKSTREVCLVLAFILIGLIYLSFGVMIAIASKAIFRDDSIEFRNLVRKGVISAAEIDRLWIMNRWWTAWAGGSLTWLEASSPCVVVKTKDGRVMRLIATAPVAEKSGHHLEISAWGIEHGFGEIKLRTRLLEWIDDQTESWRRRGD